MPPAALCSLAALAALTPTAASAQVRVGAPTRAAAAVTLDWQGGYGPFVVETSNDLLAWSEQGGPAAGRSRTLAAFARRGFLRIVDLNPANLHGQSFGLLQTSQGETGALLGRHRLKTRLWLHQTKGAPHTSPSFTALEFWRKLLVNWQSHHAGTVHTRTGSLESLGTVATPTTQQLTITWTDGAGPARRSFLLTLAFPYSVTATRTGTLPSDPTCTLQCTYATAQPELDLYQMTLTDTTVDTTTLVQLDPANPTQPTSAQQKFRVSKNGASLDFQFLEGLPLMQGSPPMIFKTLLLDRWLAPTTVGGGGLPAFSTDSDFSRTLRPGHHNFNEAMLVEPALDPALAESTRAALAAANIRYIYAFKDLLINIDPDDIRLIGFDRTIREP